MDKYRKECGEYNILLEHMKDLSINIMLAVPNPRWSENSVTAVQELKFVTPSIPPEPPPPALPSGPPLWFPPPIFPPPPLPNHSP